MRFPRGGSEPLQSSKASRATVAMQINGAVVSFA